MFMTMFWFFVIPTFALLIAGFYPTKLVVWPLIAFLFSLYSGFSFEDTFWVCIVACVAGTLFREHA